MDGAMAALQAPLVPHSAPAEALLDVISQSTDYAPNYPSSATDTVNSPVEKQSAGKRARPDELEDPKPSTPSKAVPRYTPNKLPTSANKQAEPVNNGPGSANKYGRAEGRKVQFKFEVQPRFEELDEDFAVDGPEEEIDSFKLFSETISIPPTEKENSVPRAGDERSGSAPAMRKSPAPPSNTTPGSLPERQSRPSLGLSLGLGGASRVVVKGATTRRQASDRQTLGATVSSAIQKARQGAGQRRMSLANQAAIEASNQRVRGRSAWN
jgi:hypothetical protein